MLESAILGQTIVANVAELVDALDLGSSGATRGSSSLPIRTTIPGFPVTPPQILGLHAANRYDSCQSFEYFIEFSMMRFSHANFA